MEGERRRERDAKCSQSQPQPAGNWINPFQFSAYKDKVDLKKRQRGAAWDPQAQDPPSTSVYKRKYTRLRGAHKLHTHTHLVKWWEGCTMGMYRHHPSLSLIDMFDFLFCCDLWVFVWVHSSPQGADTCRVSVANEDDGDQVTLSCVQQQTISKQQLYLTLTHVP